MRTNSFRNRAALVFYSALGWGLALLSTQPLQAASPVTRSQKRPTLAAPCEHQTPATLLTRMQRVYAKRSLSAQFEQTYVDVVSGPRNSEAGTLCINESGHMRFDYQAPEKKSFVYNGTQAWFIEPAAKQVTLLDHFSGSEAATALSLLCGGGNVLSLARLADGSHAPPAGLAGAPADAVLQFLPVGPKRGFLRLSVAVQPQSCQIESVVLEDGLNNQTIYRLTARLVGASCPADAFAKRWPKEYDVLHADALAESGVHSGG